jgi:hypothetical protein
LAFFLVTVTGGLVTSNKVLCFFLFSFGAFEAFEFFMVDLHALSSLD